MPIQTASQEINSFSKGIITEASPLTFPDNASINENNLIIENDGSRRRRYGMNYEPNYVVRSTNQAISDDIAFSSFVWKAPGGYTETEFVVVQTGTQLFIFNSTKRPVSGTLVYTTTLGAVNSKSMSFASTDGLLIIAYNSTNIVVLDWNGSAVTQTSGRLKIRDLFGVADIADGRNLLEGTDIAFRPTTIPAPHTYNLRNQTYALPRYNQNIEELRDPIATFREWHQTRLGSSKYPANSDNVVIYLYADPNDGDDPSVRRYFGDDNVLNPVGTNRAPLGYFIIDALERGDSRMSEVSKLYSQYPQLTVGVDSLPQDKTPDGASVVSSFSGRIWYSGFSSKIVGGDSESPRMGSYVLFSKLVKTTVDVFKCYQEGDPTSSETPDLIDTDGGFIRLDGAHNIQRMVNVGDSLMVIAENGVWRISGGSGYGFKATDYLTSKITEHGSVSPDSVVIVDNTIMFWSEDGIYHVSPNQYGDWIASNLTTNTVQTLFDNIPFTEKSRVKGLFDAYQRKVRWLYNTSILPNTEASELILDVNLGAFYRATVNQIANSAFPKPISLIKVPPFVIGNEDVNVIDGSGNLVVDSLSNTVTVSKSFQISAVSELLYITAVPSTDGLLRFTFSYYYDTSFRDWLSHDGIGVDAPAFLLTGWSGLGDFQRMKQIPYLTVYSLKTETGFDLNMNPINPSSILTQSQWSWSNSAESGKWGPTFQSYRHKRLWLPEDSNSDFDDGNYVVKTRNKLRGRGSVLSLKFSTEPNKDFKLLGWSYIMNVNRSP